MNESTNQWLPIIELLGVTDETKKEMLYKYAEHHAKLDATRSLYAADIHKSQLPLSLLVLEQLDNYEITKNPTDVETVVTKVRMESVDGMLPIDPSSKYESLIRQAVIDEFKDKNLKVYQLISEIRNEPDYFDEKSGTVFKTFNVISRIKISN